MSDRTEELDAVDRWLREGLEPERATVRRISGQALDARSRLRPRPGRRVQAALAGVAMLILLLGLNLWTRRESQMTTTPGSIRIINIGEVVAVIYPAGDVRLSATTEARDPNSPSLIITRGEKYVD